MDGVVDPEIDGVSDGVADELVLAEAVGEMDADGLAVVLGVADGVVVGITGAKVMQNRLWPTTPSPWPGPSISSLVQVVTKDPSSRAATAASVWSPTVNVLMTNSEVSGKPMAAI